MAHCSFCEISEEQAIEAEQERILGLLDGLFQTAPMRGDVALNDLRRLIVGNPNESAQ